MKLYILSSYDGENNYTGDIAFWYGKPSLLQLENAIKKSAYSDFIEDKHIKILYSESEVHYSDEVEFYLVIHIEECEVGKIGSLIGEN